MSESEFMRRVRPMIESAITEAYAEGLPQPAPECRHCWHNVRDNGEGKAVGLSIFHCCRENCADVLACVDPAGVEEKTHGYMKGHRQGAAGMVGPRVHWRGLACGRPDPDPRGEPCHAPRGHEPSPHLHSGKIVRPDATYADWERDDRECRARRGWFA